MSKEIGSTGGYLNLNSAAKKVAKQANKALNCFVRQTNLLWFEQAKQSLFSRSQLLQPEAGNAELIYLALLHPLQLPYADLRIQTRISAYHTHLPQKQLGVQIYQNQK